MSCVRPCSAVVLLCVTFHLGTRLLGQPYAHNTAHLTAEEKKDTVNHELPLTPAG